MSDGWWCENTPAQNNKDNLDWCCFSNQTCAEYVCNRLGSTVEIKQQVNMPTMYNCLGNASKAIELYNYPPIGGACALGHSGGKGCILNSANLLNETTTSAGIKEINLTSGSQVTMLVLIGLIWAIKRIKFFT
ncbi:uncharacterized protein L201_003490 [Kwoniella dendrophila CBS 6074]|uniref:Hydrophobin n=1 Tax=Kwoniella dendrophila CBS 6074 TaxID=1295534 RepID=A0AAX4JUM9_9TREE